MQAECRQNASSVFEVNIRLDKPWQDLPCVQAKGSESRGGVCSTKGRPLLECAAASACNILQLKSLLSQTFPDFPLQESKFHPNHRAVQAVGMVGVRDGRQAGFRFWHA